MTTLNICEWCDKEFESDKKSRFCCSECRKAYSNKKKIETCIKHYGVANPSQSKQIQNKKKKNCFEKYGVENPFQVIEIQNKMRNTLIEKYGVDNISKLTSIKNLKKQKSLEKYGTITPLQNENIKKKIVKTNRKNLGVDYPMQSEEVKNKSRQTCLKKYGVETILEDKHFREIGKQTCLKKYSVEHAMKLKETQIKAILTKQQNGSLKFSKEEESIYKCLCTKFKEVKRNYKSKEYPFHCDFYIPEIDTYIEYQGYWSHGKYSNTKIYGPYNPNNPEHLLLIKTWKEKFDKNTFKRAFNVWTISDPLKRETAKKNNLKWLEFFTVSDFNDWFNTI